MKKWNELFGQPNILLRKYRAENVKTFSATECRAHFLWFSSVGMCAPIRLADAGGLSPPSFLQFLPAVRRGELRLLVHLRLSSHAAVPVGGLALDLLPLWRDNPEVPRHLT